MPPKSIRIIEAPILSPTNPKPLSQAGALSTSRGPRELEKSRLWGCRGLGFRVL